MSRSYFYDGSSWTANDSNALHIGGDGLSAISCGSPSFCMAVGDAGNGPDAAVWDGKAWKASPIAAGTAKSFFISNSPQSISCAAAGACLAVGSDASGHAAALLFNTSGWSLRSLPISGGLSAISCVSSAFCAAIGSDDSDNFIVVHYNGSKWSASATMPTSADGTQFNDFSSISCASANFCGIGGSASSAAGESGGFASYQDGSITPPVALPTTSAVQSVACTDGNDCITTSEEYDNGMERLLATQISGAEILGSTVIDASFSRTGFEEGQGGLSCASGSFFMAAVGEDAEAAVPN
ncbi:MAG: hypothetical protein INR71_09815 [Terriglobus roseus]|nr:hypothetical protein [Terriglobus roseus]